MVKGTQFQATEKTARIDHLHIEKPPQGNSKGLNIPKLPDEEEPKESQQVSPEVEEATLEANKFIIKTCVEAIGNTGWKITGIDECRCDDISETLGTVWAPFVPQMAPITQALIVTITLVLPKLGIVASEMRKKKAQPPGKPPELETKEAKEVKTE